MSCSVEMSMKKVSLPRHLIFFAFYNSIVSCFLLSPVNVDICFLNHFKA